MFAAPARADPGPPPRRRADPRLRPRAQIQGLVEVSWPSWFGRQASRRVPWIRWFDSW